MTAPPHEPTDPDSGDWRHADIWHLLGEVEVVFGFWALVLMLFMFGISGKQEATTYLDSRNFTEPLFVFAIMVIAATRPILRFAGALVWFMARYVPLSQGMRCTSWCCPPCRCWARSSRSLRP